MKNQFRSLLEQENKEAVIPFLKMLTSEDKKKLVPDLKNLIKEYSSYVHKNGRSTIKASQEQFVILSLAAFICFDLSDYKRSGALLQISYLADGFIKYHTHDYAAIDSGEIDDILSWYCPEWLSEYLNSSANPGYKTATYQELMRWYTKGYITLTPPLIVATLSKAIYLDRYIDSKSVCTFQFQFLLDDSITLKEHIWYLFQYPSDLHYIGNNYFNGYYVVQSDEKEYSNNWIGIFQKLTANGDLDRIRVMKEALGAFHNGFNKPFTTWFSELFKALEPTVEELVLLQDTLFSALSCVHSKPVNRILSFIKEICVHKDFDTDGFIVQLPVVLSSEVKGNSIAAIAVLEKIAKKNKEIREELSSALCSVFLSKDESIQTKAAKLIVQYGNQSEKVKETLFPYSDSVLMAVKIILKDYLTETTNIENTTLVVPESVSKGSFIREDNYIPKIKTLEDLVFLAGQTFNSNAVYCLDLLPAVLLQFNNQITGETVIQLESAFQKAYKLQKESVFETGIFKNLLSCFFISYGQLLCKRFPEQASGLSKMHYDAVKEELQKAADFPSYIAKTGTLETWETRLVDRRVFPYYSLLQETLNRIEIGNTIPLLSTFTHLPGWIDPVVLAERLLAYQEAGAEPLDMDLQLAVSRCALDSTEPALVFIRKYLKGEYKDLLLYLLGAEPFARERVKHPIWWLTAGITAFPETIVDEFSFLGYENLSQEWIKGQSEWKILAGTLKLKIPKLTIEVLPFLYECLPQDFPGYNIQGIDPKDLPYLLLSYPNRTDLILIQIIQARMNRFDLSGSEERNIVTQAIVVLQELNIPFSETTYLFLALAMLNPDKTIRNYAAEIWIQQVTQNTIDNIKIGLLIGQIEKKEWGPLKRFTDLITGNLLGISTKHNHAIEETIVGVLSLLDEKPIKDLKKLLEIYKEVLALNNSKVAIETISLLEIWKQKANLKKVIQQLR